MDESISYVFTLDTNGTEEDDQARIDQLSQMVREGTNVSGPLQVLTIEDDKDEGDLPAGVFLMAGEVSLFINEKDVPAFAAAIETAHWGSVHQSGTEPRFSEILTLLDLRTPQQLLLDDLVQDIFNERSLRCLPRVKLSKTVSRIVALDAEGTQPVLDLEPACHTLILISSQLF
jgi:hypothetical protein